MKRAFYLLTLGAALALGGCETTRYHPPPPLTGDPLTDGRNAMDHGPAKDKVLWEYRVALTALRQGKPAEAKPLLDDALTRLGNLFGKDPSARQARGLFHAEAKKTFIGEPYERAMAYYYRGILYWMDGEPDNARACFRSAALEDSDTADKKYASDYVLFDYLDGLASVKLSADGADAFKRAVANAKLSTPPAYDPKANVLFFVDYGPGPTKYAVGEYAKDLMFRAGSTPVRSVQIQVGGQTFQLRPYDDLYFQATTRGGRVMDHILANKAKFKSATDAVGNAALLGGAGLAVLGGRDAQPAALGLLAAGVLSKIASAATSPEADTRSWDNLPLCLSFAALPLAPGQYTARVDFLDASNRLLLGLTKTLTFTVPSGPGDKVIYVSDKSATPQNL